MHKPNAVFRLGVIGAVLFLLGADPGAPGEMPAPPPMPENYSGDSPEAVQERLKPEVKRVQRGTELVEEYRVQNRLYMIKITPQAGEPYYLVDRTGDGRFTRSEGEAGNSVPLWVIRRFR